MSREDADGLTGRCPPRQCVARDLLAGQAVKEEPGRPGGQAHGEARGGLEERDHRVEVAVGRGAVGPAGRARCLPRPGQAGGVPHRPQGVVRVAVARGVAGERQQGCHPPGRVRGRDVDQGEVTRVAEHGSKRLVRHLLAGVLRGRPQRPPEPAQAQGVAAAQRPGQELRGGVLVERARPQRAPQEHEQRLCPRLGRERQLVPGDHRGHPGRHQRAPQQRDLMDHRPDQDRHRRPAHAVVQVRAPQHVGDHGGLLAAAGGGDHPHHPRRGGWQRVQVAVAARRGWQPACHPPGRRQQDGPAAPAGAQRDDAGGPVVGSAEPLREAGDPAHVRAPEGVDRLVRVTDRDQLPAVPGQGVQQRLLGRVSVLVLIHQDHVIGLALAVPGRAVGQQRRGDPDDLRVVVGRDRCQVEPRRVAVEETARGLPVVPPALPSQQGQAPAVQATFGGAEQEVPQLGGEPTGRERGAQALGPLPATVPGLAPEHAPDLQQLLRARQQGGRLVAGQHELPAYQRVRVAVEGQRQRLPRGPAQPCGDPLPQLLGRLAAEGENEHPLRVDPAVGDAVGHGLHDRGGLARTRAGQHQQRAPGVVDDGSLRGVQRGRLVRSPRRADEAVGGKLPVHVRTAFQQNPRTSRGCLALRRGVSEMTA